MRPTHRLLKGNDDSKFEISFKVRVMFTVNFVELRKILEKLSKVCRHPNRIRTHNILPVMEFNFQILVRHTEGFSLFL